MASNRVDASVVKFNGSNYRQWKQQITLSLKIGGLYGYADGTIKMPEVAGVDQNKWLTDDLRAQAMIATSLDESTGALVYACETANEMWTKIERDHDDKSEFTKQILYGKFYNFKIEEDESLLEAYREVEDLVASLRDMGETISESSVVSKITTALPKSHEAFQTAWDSVQSSEQTMAYLLQRLKKEEAKRLEGGTQESYQGKGRAYATRTGGNCQRRSRKEDICNYCRKPGHWARDCHQKKAEQKRQEFQGFKMNPANAFLSEVRQLPRNEDEIWYCDSGCTQHLTGRKEWLMNYRDLTDSSEVTLANGSQSKRVGIGDVRVMGLINGKWEECMIKDVLYLPGHRNLFSVSTH